MAADKRIAVFLKDGSAVVSEDMDADAAQTEFDRIVAVLPHSGGGVVQVGKGAAFRTAEFLRIEIQDGDGPMVG